MIYLLKVLNEPRLDYGKVLIKHVTFQNIFFKRKRASLPRISPWWTRCFKSTRTPTSKNKDSSHLKIFRRRYNTQHNDTEDNDVQHNNAQLKEIQLSLW